MSTLDRQSPAAMPAGWVREYCCYGSLQSRRFLLDVVLFLFADKVDDVVVWNSEKETSGADLLDYILDYLNGLELVPEGAYVPFSWDRLLPGDRVAIFLGDVVHLPSEVPVEPQELLEFSSANDLRGLDGSWLVEDPQERTLRRIIEDCEDSQTLSTHLYRHCGDKIFVEKNRRKWLGREI